MSNYTFGQKGITENFYDIYLRVHDISWKDKPANLSNFVEASSNHSDPTVYIGDDESSFDETTDLCWFKVGRSSEKPTMKESADGGLTINTGDELNSKKKNDVEFELLEFSKSNLESLVDLFDSKLLDVLYVDTNEAIEKGSAVGYGANKLQFSLDLALSGNDYNKIKIKGNRTCRNYKAVISPINVAT